MSVVKINVLEVPEGKGEVLEERFAARAGEVDKVDGFESFELLRPTEGTDRYLVVTKWRDEDSFKAWMDSAAFQRGHAQSQQDAEAAGEQGHGGHGGHGHGGEGQGHGGEGHGGHGQGDAPKGGPAAVGSELWGFEVILSSTGQNA
jgi:heme oxygenase (mycobilin-producing)